MNLSTLLGPLRGQSTYQILLDQLLEKTSPDEALEIPKAVRPMLVSALYEDLQQPILYIVPRLDRLLTLHEEIPNWTPNVELHRFPNPNPLFYELSPWSEAVRNERTSALAFLTQGEGPGSPQEETPGQSLMLLASSRALMTRTLPKRTFLANSRYVKQGAVFRFDKLLSLLGQGVEAGSSARFRLSPISLDQALSVQAMEGWVESTLLHVQNPLRPLPDGPGDAVAMDGFALEGAEDEKVQRTCEKIACHRVFLLDA